MRSLTFYTGFSFGGWLLLGDMESSTGSIVFLDFQIQAPFPKTFSQQLSKKLV